MIQYLGQLLLWVPAFRKSVVDGALGIQAALWWSIEQSYNPIPHMQQVSPPDLFWC
jgi:hypothetical protein